MNVNEPIKVAIADDHKIFRDGIRMALSGKEYLKIILMKFLRINLVLYVLPRIHGQK